MISCIVKIKLHLNMKHGHHERIQIHNFTVISRVILQSYVFRALQSIVHSELLATRRHNGTSSIFPTVGQEIEFIYL